MISAQDLSIGYGKALLEHIDFDVEQGECIMLCGANGSGKSTLLKTIAGICKPIKGNISVLGDVAMVPTRIPKVKGFTLKDFVRMSCFSFSDWSGRIGPTFEKRINDVLSILKIDFLANKDIATLSDGEFQKGCIATALVRQPKVIILDEPTAFLDIENRVSILETLHEIASNAGSDVIFSTHDLHEGIRSCDRVLSIGWDGKVRMSSKEMLDKIETVKKGFKNKNIIFED
jgi:iron complex transport system ATP-binding protein